MLKRLLAQTARPEESPLVCSSPFYAPVAELWPGPVIYYVTDLNVAYEGLNPFQVLSLDLRMCRVARIVCPNSRRIASYLVTEAACDPDKITIIPNATRESNLLASPQYDPAVPPPDVADLERPIIGVLGDLSGNMNWELIVECMQRTPGYSWLFVGPTNRSIKDGRQRAARAWAKHHARFVGMKPYGELQSYARCVDAAVLPYMKREPTYSGSSTRFYEHLAAGRPMVATRGFAELLEKEPLLTLVDTAEEMAAALERLRAMNFRDGQEAARWEASKQSTWEVRARTMRHALQVKGAVPAAAAAHPRVEVTG
jgi:glycosyltransferase involved in cell wall biosynthesis